MSVLHTKGLSQEVRLCNLPTLRQAFIVAGLLIFVGLLLTYYVNGKFIILPVLVGSGLMFSGTIGFCPMVYFLQKLPWNRNS